MKSLPIDLSDEVADALATGSPIVSLESSIIAQGLPFPTNIETAIGAETTIRKNGAVPATIAILDGRIKVGIDASQIEFLAKHKSIVKVGAAELPIILAKGSHGATTVSATMICSHLSSISVFATGGIGGVHTNATETFDISQDLTEFTRSPVIVVASGAKSILDIPKTLEMLETLGVSVAVFGQDEFPAFWCRSSGLNAPARLDGPEKFATAFELRRRIGLRGGFLAANPIPADAEINRTKLLPWIEQANAEVVRLELSGKQVTPFLLDWLAERSQGATILANQALVYNNAKVAAQISTCLAKHNSDR